VPRPHTDIDPEMMLDGALLAVFHIEAGSRAFADYGREMLADIGAKFRLYLQSWYEATRHWSEMDNAGTLSAAEIEAGVDRGPAAAGPQLVSEADPDTLRGRLRANAAGLRADAEMAAAERELAEIAPGLSDEERTEIEATGAAGEEADRHAAACQEAAVCLRAA
jgi:hypothetical protein